MWRRRQDAPPRYVDQVREARISLGASAVALALLATGCSSAPPETEATLAIPHGFEFEDLFMPDVWVSTPARSDEACGLAALTDCWESEVLVESDCDGSVLLSFEERREAGAKLEEYQHLMPRTASPGASELFVWSSQFHNPEVIDSIAVTSAECVAY